MDERPHRPARYADLTGFIDAAGGQDPVSRAEVAAATAAVLLDAGRAGDDPGDAGADRFVCLVDRIGIETLGALWRDSDPVSLPGALWALYLLRHWFRTDPERVRLLWRAGAPLAPADSAVAGVAEPQDAPAMQDAADAVLRGLFRGDVGVALDRAAALFRVLAAGRRDLAESRVETRLGPGTTDGASDSGSASLGELDRADRNEQAAADLSAAATQWRRGRLG